MAAWSSAARPRRCAVGVTGKAEAGGQFGATVAVGDADQTIAAVGAPGEDLGKRRNAGMVTVFTFTDDKAHRLTALRSFTQNSRGIPGRAQSGDQFGAALDAGGTLCDEEQNDVAVGAPGENLGRARDAGTVTVIPVQDVLEGCRLLRQVGDPVAGTEHRVAPRTPRPTGLASTGSPHMSTGSGCRPEVRLPQDLPVRDGPIVASCGCC